MVHRAHGCDHHPLALSTHGLVRQQDDAALLQVVERRSQLITVRDDDVSKSQIIWCSAIAALVKIWAASRVILEGR